MKVAPPSSLDGGGGRAGTSNAPTGSNPHDRAASQEIVAGFKPSLQTAAQRVASSNQNNFENVYKCSVFLFEPDVESKTARHLQDDMRSGNNEKLVA